MFEVLKLKMRLIGAVVAIALSLLAGWKLSNSFPKLPTSPIAGGGGTENDTEQVIVEETKPDGTVVRRIENRSSSKVPRRNWSASAYLVPKWNDLTNPGFALGVGRRILDTNMHGVIEYVSVDNTLMFGIRIDF